MSIDAEPTVRKLNSLLQRHLVAICKAERLPVSGNKAGQQARIVERLRRFAQVNDVVNFTRLKSFVDNPESTSIYGNSSPAANSYSSLSPATNPHQNNSSRFNTAYTPGASIMGQVNGVNSNPRGAPSALLPRPHAPFSYKPSPFYKPRFQIGSTQFCEIMKNHRHTVDISIRAADYPMLDAPDDKDSIRLLIYCTDHPESYHGQRDIVFPWQSEIKVNGGEVKANLRGLKNKPGSVRPVDVTQYMRLKPNVYSNKVELTYALTDKRFWLSVWAVQAVPVAELVKQLQVGQKITQASVLHDMVKKASDPDIETTSTVLSLKCPISTLRFDLPCRGIACKHNQCFDATSYLQLQEQAPTWLCPICNNPTAFAHLAVDEYVKDILKLTSRSIDQVTVEPNGKWSTAVKAEAPDFSNSSAIALGDDDDLVEVDNVGRRSQSINNYGNPSFSPATHLGEQRASSSSDVPRRPSGKRPISTIVDLTLSDDEDDEPPRPAQRPRLSMAQESSRSSTSATSHVNGVSRPSPLGGAYGHV